MTLDATARPLADQLINQLGKAAIIRRIDPGTVDPVTGVPSGGSTTDHNVKVTPPSRYRMELVAEALVQADDFECSVAALDLTIEPDVETDKLVLDGEQFAVKGVQPVYSGELVAYYSLQCGK